jgi:hypothetical protein
VIICSDFVIVFLLSTERILGENRSNNNKTGSVLFTGQPDLMEFAHGIGVWFVDIICRLLLELKRYGNV